MEFTAERSLLLPALECLVVVAKNPHKSFERVDHLSIKAEKGRLLLAASNGYVTAVQEVKDDNKLAVITEGETVVSTLTMMKMVKACNEDDRLSITADDKALSRKILGKKRELRIPVFNEPAAVELKSVSSKSVYSLSSDMFMDSIAEAAPWASLEEYRDRYRQLYMEFSANETRFVCGDGSKFVVIVNKDSTNEKKFSGNDNKGYIIPATQASVIESIIKNSDVKKMKITFGEMSYLFETDAGLSILLEGIPVDYAEYVPYRMQSERMDERLISVEINGAEFKTAFQDMESVRDPDFEKKHTCIPVLMTANENDLTFKAKFSNEFDCSVTSNNYQVHKADKTMVWDEYDFNTLGALLKLGSSDRYELSFLGGKDIVFCRFLDDSDVRSRLVFFSAVADSGEK